MKKVIVSIITCILIITYIMPVNVFAFDNSDKVILIESRAWWNRWWSKI